MEANTLKHFRKIVMGIVSTSTNAVYMVQTTNAQGAITYVKTLMVHSNVNASIQMGLRFFQKIVIRKRSKADDHS